jgi:hypothetical protein
MANQTHTKSCNQCNKSKPLTDFYKMSLSKDNRQPKCKECCKIVNQNFRTIKPKYQVDWQRTNSPRWNKYIGEWNKVNCKADDSRSAIYYIIAPDNMIYVGHSQTRFYQRKSSHKKEYKLNKGALPYLHQSFDAHGYDNHSWVVMDMAGMDKDTLQIIEYAMANEFTKLGISLNKRLK